MARLLKLPNELKEWKVVSRLADINDNSVFEVSKNEFDGSTTKAKLLHVVFDKEKYTSDNVVFINEEANFIKSIAKTGSISNYIDVFTDNIPTKEKAELYIFFENFPTLAECLSSKNFSESEVVDFGIKMSEILETLEANNVYHGNINPDNIFVTPNGEYKLGGFTDFDGIKDKSFLAPEIDKNKQADFTTDIYSLGLIMYYMSNNNLLPFCLKAEDKQEAISKRLEGNPVSAPENGGEKLKSVIVIACQPENKNRWKNAGNIKNALTSIKSELSVEEKPNDEVIIPQNTDFDGNVFEEYDYEDTVPEQNNEDETEEKNNEEAVSENNEPQIEPHNDEPENDKEEKAETEDKDSIQNKDNSNENDSIKPIHNDNETDNFDVVEAPKENIEAPQKNQDSITNSTEKSDVDSTPETNSNEIDNRVFDNYEPTKIINLKQPSEEKDYGDYFDDEPKDIKSKSSEQLSKDNDDNNSEFDVPASSYKSDTDSDDNENTKKSKKGIIILVAAIVVILAALGVCGYFAVTNGWFGNSKPVETTESTTAEVATTAQPTTAAQTTVEPTTETQNVDKFVLPVVGYGYQYAKEMLENEGFVVQIGEYRYSTKYEEGYVIAQYPDESTIAQKGSVITLDISSGLISDNSDDNQSSQSSNSSKNNDSDNSSDNNYSYNTSYISQSEVENMSREELNLALNEIYARRGRIFEDPTLSAYFNSKDWYTPKYTAAEFSKNVTFNEYEQANLQLLINEQEKRGYR